MICSSAFWKQKWKNLKNISLTFFKFQSIPSYSVSGQGHLSTVLLHCHVVIKIIYNKFDNYFFVSADRQTFLGFEMTANLRDTSPLSSILSSPVQIYVFQVFHFHILTSWYDISKRQAVSISRNGFYSTPIDQQD